MDLDAVRTFVVATRVGQFQEAAAELGITQQAVSRRIAVLEAELGVRLFTRTPRGAVPTVEGNAFAPHAHALLAAARRAAESVRPTRRPLRVDILGRGLAPAALLRAFHRTHPDVELDIVTLATLPSAEAAVAAVRAGEIDATLRAPRMPASGLPKGVRAVRALDEPLELLTGATHELAAAAALAPADLAGHRIWIPGIVSGTEWAAYYDELAAAFGLRIDAADTDFGAATLLDTLADSPSVATIVGAQTRLSWAPDQDLRRIPLREPTPVYPHSLVWRPDNPHPALAALREHVGSIPCGPAAGTWAPTWT